MFPSLSTLIGGGTDLGDVGSPVGNGPIYIGVETRSSYPIGYPLPPPEE